MTEQPSPAPAPGRGKMILAIAVTAIVVGAVVGIAVHFLTPASSTPNTTPSNKVTVTMPVYSSEYAGLKQLVPSFEKQYPNVTVDLTSYSYTDLQTQEFDAMGTNSSTWSVYMWDCVWAGTVAQGHTYNLSTLQTEFPNLWANYSSVDGPSTTWNLQQQTYADHANGQAFGLVWNANVQVLFYNKTLFDSSANQNAFKSMFGYTMPNPANGMNLTQFMNVSQFFTQKTSGTGVTVNPNSPTQYGTTLINAEHGLYYEFLNFFAPYRYSTAGNSTFGDQSSNVKSIGAHYGSYFGVQNGNVVSAVNSQLGTQALEYYGNLSQYAPSPVTTTYGEGQSDYTQGTSATLVGWVLQGASILSAVGSKNFAIAPMPGGWPDDGTWQIGVNSHAANAWAAYAWFLYVTDPSSEQLLWNTTTSMPGNIAVAHALSTQPANSWMTEGFASLNGTGAGLYGASHRSSIPQTLEMEYSMSTYFSDYLDGTISASTAISDVNAAWQGDGVP